MIRVNEYGIEFQHSNEIAFHPSVWNCMHLKLNLPRFVLVNRTGGAGGLSSSLDILNRLIFVLCATTFFKLNQQITKRQEKKIDF